MYETHWNIPDAVPQDSVLKVRSLHGSALQERLDT